MSYALYTGGASPSVIPRHISSASATGLERKMLLVQTRLQGQIRWQIMTNATDGKFYAWYTVDIDMDEASKASKGNKLNV